MTCDVPYIWLQINLFIYEIIAQLQYQLKDAVQFKRIVNNIIVVLFRTTLNFKLA